MIWNPNKECMSRDEMHALQSKRLQKLVTYVYHNVPFYRNKMQAMDLSPEDIRSIAGSLSSVSKKEIDRSKVAASMIEALHHMDMQLLTGKADMMARYRRDCITLGQEVSLVRGEEIRHGTALDIDEDGALIVRFSDGKQETVNSGEVSVRGMYGYV